MANTDAMRTALAKPPDTQAGKNTAASGIHGTTDLVVGGRTSHNDSIRSQAEIERIKIEVRSDPHASPILYETDRVSCAAV